jgi:hypothetical protein
MNVLDFITAIRESDPYIETIYTKGSCYQFHLLLRKFWPNAKPVTNQSADHVGSLIDGEIYDISGIVIWSWRAMDDDDIAEAEGWSFAKNSFLQVGECPICEEPLLA